MSNSTPESREELIQYALRRLGHPVLKINVARSQIEDLVDDAIQYFVEYAQDGTERGFLNHKVTQKEIEDQTATASSFTGTLDFADNSTGLDPNAQDTITSSGGFLAAGFKNGDIIEATDTVFNDGQYLIAGLTDTVITLAREEKLRVETVDGTVMTIDRDRGKYIQMHPSVLNVKKVLLLTNDNLSSGMFGVQYQFMLNNVHDIAFGNLINYETTRQYLNLIQFMFVGDKELRFKRNQNRLYIDVSWKDIFKAGDYVLIECYRKLNPESYPTMYNEIFLKRYLVALIKKQWGENLKKYRGVSLPGGFAMNGQSIYNEAADEVKKLEDEIIDKYSEPPYFFVG